MPGTAVFMTSNPDGIPPVLLHHVKHNKMLHEQVVLLSIQTEQVPSVPFGKNFGVAEVGEVQAGSPGQSTVLDVDPKSRSSRSVTWI